MLAKAHITIGMAAALTIAAPESIPEALPVITGASLGCLICDLDCDNPREKQDSSHWRIVMFCRAERIIPLVRRHCRIRAHLRVRERLEPPGFLAFVCRADSRSVFTVARVPCCGSSFRYSLCVTPYTRYDKQEARAGILSA